MLSYKTKYCLSDVCITPAMITNINSRSECKTLSEFTSGKVQLVIKSPETNHYINK